jgi:hypothetical protein
VERTPRAFPKLAIGPKMDGAAAVNDVPSREVRIAWSVDKALEELLSFEFDRIALEGYEPHGKISMVMSV